jgi:hypothetical protein
MSLGPVGAGLIYAVVGIGLHFDDSRSVPLS